MNKELTDYRLEIRERLENCLATCVREGKMNCLRTDLEDTWLNEAEPSKQRIARNIFEEKAHGKVVFSTPWRTDDCNIALQVIELRSGVKIIYHENHPDNIYYRKQDEEKLLNF